MELTVIIVIILQTLLFFLNFVQRYTKLNTELLTLQFNFADVSLKLPRVFVQCPRGV